MTVQVSRRELMAAMAATTTALALPEEALAQPKRGRWAAKPPAGFVRMSLPGKVVRVSKASSLQANGAWPKQEAAKVMLQRAMQDLTGESDLGKAFGMFVHKDDKVAIKPNGIAGRKFADRVIQTQFISEAQLNAKQFD